MQIIETARAWLYVWYIGGTFAIAFMLALATAPDPEFDGGGGFNVIVFFTVVAIGLVGCIPVIVIFTVLAKMAEVQASMAKTQSHQTSALLARLDRLIDVTRGTEGGSSHGDDAPVAVGPDGAAIAENESDAAEPSHSVYHSEPTEDEREINSRPFPNF